MVTRTHSTHTCPSSKAAGWEKGIRVHRCVRVSVCRDRQCQMNDTFPVPAEQVKVTFRCALLVYAADAGACAERYWIHTPNNRPTDRYIRI